MSDPKHAYSQDSRSRLERVLRFLERVRQRWVDQGASMTAFKDIDYAIDDLKQVLQQSTGEKA